ncbi:hypothetical protein ACERIT_07345 [Halopenitus sp. H-Gu1]|uniref:hypothetical protein n=1 Tax=Halopenitus sp. H-Gu1 TaxID=3242697 RepID=UPI00359D647B
MTETDSTTSPDARSETSYQLTGSRPSDKPYSVTAIARDDWEPGQPCPECGTSHLHEMHLNEECAIHHDGSSAFSAALDRLGTVEYWCPECETVLYRHAAYALWLALTNNLDHDASV